jgi:hypothetical protein
MHVGYWWESRNERDPLGRPRHRWKDNITIHCGRTNRMLSSDTIRTAQKTETLVGDTQAQDWEIQMQTAR